MSVPSYFRNDGWVKSATGAAVPGAQIYVCTQPANLTVPPTPLANIYSDPNGVVPITQPIITDGFGHYDFYVLPGTYTIIVALGGVIQQSYTDQTIGMAGATSLTAGSGISIINNVISNTVPPQLPKKLGWAFADGQVASTNPSVVGLPSLFQNVSGGAATVMSPAGTIAGEGPSFTMKGLTTVSTNTDCSWMFGRDTGGSNNVSFTLNAVQRISIRQRTNSNTTRRFWVGLTSYTGVFNNATFATDTPNQGYVAFRFSTAAGDTTWKAVAGISNVAQTVVDTGVAYTGNAMQFDIAPSAGGTAVNFYINQNLVATISTSLPAADTGLCAFGTGDNCNTGSNQPVIDFMYAVAQFN